MKIELISKDIYYKILGTNLIPKYNKYYIGDVVSITTSSHLDYFLLSSDTPFVFIGRLGIIMSSKELTNDELNSIKLSLGEFILGTLDITFTWEVIRLEENIIKSSICTLNELRRTSLYISNSDCKNIKTGRYIIKSRKFNISYEIELIIHDRWCGKELLISYEKKKNLFKTPTSELWYYDDLFKIILKNWYDRRENN